ncbi:rab GTPase-activating protein 1-like [Drosophila novamexicana]|uniref:rab GTPase-activating protein 1-like n=1 Tax=Drosophila novamexicana TaxID=47314 RepID=UPI0011E60044|nr:rab GTPase-activating protein 1-like [Drosophila novamexicana]
MDDNLSTKSSESSITTSGEYEIVNDSNVTTPLEQLAPPPPPAAAAAAATVVAKVTESLSTLSLSPVGDASCGDCSPTLDMAHNRNLSDIQHEMTDALRDLQLERNALAAVADKTRDQQQQQQRSQQQQQQQEQQQQQKSLTLPLAGRKTQTAAAGDSEMRFKCSLFSPKACDESEDASNSEQNRVGQSVFYDCIDASPACIEEKQDAMKPEKCDTTDEEVSEIDQGCTIFAGVTYLGAANINAPKSETDVFRIMSELNSGSKSVGLKITVSIPNCSDGLVVLHDAESNTIIATYEISSIILYYRGPVDTAENGCFAFTWLHGDALFQCHVFRCHIPEAVNQVSACFQKAFQTYAPSMSCSLTSAVDMVNSVTSDVSGNPLNTAGYEFIVSLEIREKVAKNSYAPVPRDRGCFKLRANTDKEVSITVKQTASNVLQPLYIERCFGVLVAPGKLVVQKDMHLIDMLNMGYVPAQGAGIEPDTVGACLNAYAIRAEWKAQEKAFEQLNLETSKTNLTVAVDIVMRGIQEPVRFVIETPVTIQSASDMRIMDHFMSKRPMTLRFYLHLKRTDELNWKVNSIDPSEEIIEPPSGQQGSASLLKMGMNNLSRIVRSSSIASIEDDCPTDYSSDGDEPLLSGTGEVSKDCSQDTLDEWDPILREWDSEKRPKNLAPLVRLGVPEALREKIWQKLANVEGKVEMNDMYKILITKETKCETVIQRDIHRTFPAHKCFKESGGSGQDALFKVSKAYAVHDSEVGYCQGLSFIAASLLLHMPEEDAFCVLVALMYDYGLRDLYKAGFEVLYLRLYQLERLIKDQLPKLHEHFTACGIETHMYASQWFLTLYTARFPLCFVFHVLDVFLLDGLPVLFQVAVTLLSICESDLRQLDFEGILKYFRVTLPKKCRSSSQARKVMKQACERKIKKLKQYEEEFLLKKQHKERLEKEAQIYENRFGEERRKLQSEIEALTQQLAGANERAVDKEKKHTGIIQEYKQIIQRQEQDMNTLNETLGKLMHTVSKCSHCLQQIDVGNDNAKQQLAPGCSSERHPHPLRNANEPPLGPLDPLNVAAQRIRELELELAQAKLAQVEAECKNQDLNHQLNNTLSELQTNRNSWQPWLSKTFNSLQEKVSTRSGNAQRADQPGATFQSYTGQAATTVSEASSPSAHQEYKAFAFASVGGSPKLPTKFQATKLRNSIDSLRNIVGPLETGKTLLAENLKQQLQSQP